MDIRFVSVFEMARVLSDEAIVKDIAKAVGKIQQRSDWLERCMLAMDVKTPKAVIWQRIKTLQRYLF